ncbi:MAG: [acyl-carrier-protein] S-malonyltransferase [Alphaproteobacteria bacterium]|nr:MAG: [acyl-carrier-protein] S-malonyltransferase [Alphaproteobacteria bacterium]
MTRAFVFPGQGSQFIGMGKDLAENFVEARDVFQEVDDTLSQKLSAMMFDGEESDLNLTENTQPALMAMSMAVINILQKQGDIQLEEHCAFVAGHSLGEYAALTSAGTIALADTARLLKLRGTSMQKAVPVGVGSMAAILGLDFDVVAQIAQDAAGDQICTAANDNSDGQVVVSGHKEAVERAVALATERGARKAIILAVSAPFHCDLMAPAAETMTPALAETTFNAPVVPVVANVTAAKESDPETLKKLLIEQITGTVRWRESVLYMRDQGVTEMVEIGAGKVLSGLARRIDRSIACESVGTVEQIENLIKKLKG